MSQTKVGNLRFWLDTTAADESLVPTEELSEEDQNLKNELEMLVERLKVAIPGMVSRLDAKY